MASEEQKQNTYRLIFRLDLPMIAMIARANDHPHPDE